MTCFYVQIFLVFRSYHVTKNTSETNSHLGNSMECWINNRLIIVRIRIIIIAITMVTIILICSLTKGTIEYWSRCPLCTPMNVKKRRWKENKPLNDCYIEEFYPKITKLFHSPEMISLTCTCCGRKECVKCGCTLVTGEI